MKDHQQICFLSSCYDFPWDFTRSLELALFRTFGVAKGTPLLERTGEFVKRTRKRYDDTVLILGEILEYGYDSPRGKAALRRMNQQHGRYPILNDKYLYTLSTFVLEPMRWINRYGWRPYTKHERIATFTYWLEMGKRMNIKDLPASLEDLEQFNIAYEREHFRYAPSNEKIATATRDLLLSMYLPRWLWGAGKPFVYALIDEPLLKAVGFPNPPTWLRRIAKGGLKLKARVRRQKTLNRHVDDVHAILEHLHVKQATLIGHSMGGGIALDFALEYPERVRSLILVDSILGGYTMSAAWEAAIAPVWAQGRAGNKEGARNLWMNHALFEAVLSSNAADVFRRIVTEYSGWHWVSKNPIQTLKPPALERLETIQALTLVIVGENDLPDFHGIADTLTQRIPNTRKQIIARAGHMCNMEAPRAFSEVVFDFIQSLDPSS